MHLPTPHLTNPKFISLSALRPVCTARCDYCLGSWAHHGWSGYFRMLQPCARRRNGELQICAYVATCGPRVAYLELPSCSQSMLCALARCTCNLRDVCSRLAVPESLRQSVWPVSSGEVADVFSHAAAARPLQWMHALASRNIDAFTMHHALPRVAMRPAVACCIFLHPYYERNLNSCD